MNVLELEAGVRKIYETGLLILIESGCRIKFPSLEWWWLGWWWNTLTRRISHLSFQIRVLRPKNRKENNHVSGKNWRNENVTLHNSVCSIAKKSGSSFCRSFDTINLPFVLTSHKLQRRLAWKDFRIYGFIENKIPCNWGCNWWFGVQAKLNDAACIFWAEKMEYEIDMLPKLI